MLLRTSISNTKKFFKKTLDNVKSLLSGGTYQRLPKTPPPCNSFPCNGGNGMDLKYSKSYRELDKVYSTTNQWGVNIEDKSKIAIKKKENSSPVKSFQVAITKTEESKIVYKGKRYQDLSVSKGVKEDQERGFLVVKKKLKELEMMDKSNVEHVLDIEEILHYYSRLTCPAYLDIVESFFMEMYKELLTVENPTSVSL